MKHQVQRSFDWDALEHQPTSPSTDPREADENSERTAEPPTSPTDEPSDAAQVTSPLNPVAFETRDDVTPLVFVRPDRQVDYSGTLHHEWPKPQHDRDTITVDRIHADIDGPSHRFVIKRDDVVEVFFSSDKVDVGTVVGISHARDEVKVRFPASRDGIWFYKGKIYPASEDALPTEPKTPKVPLTQVIEQLNEKHGGELTEDDRVAAEPVGPDEVLGYLKQRPGFDVKLSELRQVLGETDFDPSDPLASPIHRAVKELRDKGLVHVEEPKWGEASVSFLIWPETREQFSKWHYPKSLSGPDIVHLMKKQNVTIKELAVRMGFTQKHIREVRERGIEGQNTVRDWAEAIIRPEVEGGVFTLADHKAFRERADSGEITASEWKQEFARMVSSRTEIMSELEQQYTAPKLKALALRLGDMSASRNTKPENARSVYRSLLRMFVLGDSFTYQPMRQKLEDAIQERVEAITQDDLDAHFKKQGVRREAYEKATTNPETLDEFRTFIRHRGEQELSDEQLTKFDQLQADVTRDRRAQQKAPDTVQQVQADTGDLELSIIEGYHSKRECTLHIVQLSTRVDRSVFNELKTKAKQLGGWYSSFVKSQAGFQFLERATAEKFVALLSSDQDRTEELDARRERKEQTAAERLTRLAKELHDRADETIDQSKAALQNTVRRAEMQAGIRGRAYADQALARTIARVAQALETGNAKYLDGIRHKTHVELLTYLARRAKTNHLQTQDRKLRATGESLSFDDRESRRERPIELTDIAYVKYPYPTIYKRHLQEAVEQSRRAKGAIQASKKMAKRLRQEKGEYVTFSEDHDVNELTDFLSRVKAAGHETEWMDREVSDWKRARACNIFTIQELRCALRELLPLIGEAQSDSPVAIAERELIGKKLPGFFPTPRPVIAELLDLADIQPGHRVLEPSCGKGDIADAIREEYPDAFLTLVEINRTLADVLSAKGHDPVFADFLTYGGGTSFDRIIGNPPFERGQDIDHVRHAYDLLAANGKLVMVMCEGPFFRSDSKSVAFREWLDEVGGYSVELPDESFKGVEAFRETSVRTRIVVVEKQP